MLLHWSDPPITLDDFRDPPLHVFIFQANWVVPLCILPNFSAILLLGSQLRLITFLLKSKRSLFFRQMKTQKLAERNKCHFRYSWPLCHWSGWFSDLPKICGRSSHCRCAFFAKGSVIIFRMADGGWGGGEDFRGDHLIFGRTLSQCLLLGIF